MQHLDKAIQPPDRDEPEDNGEKLLLWCADNFTPQQVYGDDVHEQPSLEFCKWTILNRWHFICDQWHHPDEPSPINDDELFQRYLNDKG